MLKNKKKFLKLFGNMATNFSTVPIRIFSIAGLIIAFLNELPHSIFHRLY